MTPIHPGDQIDHYRIESEAARSGMATIFRGTDLRTGDHVAIKVPHPEMECDPVFFDRFRREEEIGQRLDHPGVVKVRTGADRCRVYMVMEWVDGRLLREVLHDEPKLQPDRAVLIALGLCDALEHIHSHGVVHRDLKPDNVMVGPGDRVKLIDFGIAGMSGARRLTFGKFSKLTGTPDYISPEQVKGKRGDARSDIYALGVILYEMLTGQTPVQGPSPLATMNARLHNGPIPPRSVAPEISPALEEILYRALARDPRNRYGSAREFAWDLEHQDRVGVVDRTECPQQQNPTTKRVAFYSALAMIPLVIFGLLLYVAGKT